jgi:hypothetical protein
MLFLGALEKENKETKPNDYLIERLYKLSSKLEEEGKYTDQNTIFLALDCVEGIKTAPLCNMPGNSWCGGKNRAVDGSCFKCGEEPFSNRE